MERLHDPGMEFLSAVRSQLYAHRLDAELATGADPASAPELARRAQRLTSSRFRAKLAAGLEHAVSDEGFALSAAVRSPAVIARAVAPSVTALARQLRGAGDVRPQGVAQALLLLTDGTSALYSSETTDDAVDAVARIQAAL
jgi:hypothetical protein